MKRPHLLFITTDQQRGDCLGINGHPVLSTPNLDYLGRAGSNFPHAYAETPSCIPARRTMISGMKPFSHGMVGYQDGIEWELEHSLPGELAKVGYQTELVGKLHLWPHRKRYGFDHLTWADSPRSPNDYTDWLRDNGATAIEPGIAHGISMNGWVGRPSHLPEEMEHTNWCVNEAMRFLMRRDPSAPFFLWVSFFAPHPPLAPPRVYYDRYMDLDLPEPVVGDWAPRFDEPMKGLDPNASRLRLDAQTMKRCRAAYYGCINHVDDQVGRLFAFMQKLGLLKDTFIIMTSDHGEMLGDHNMFRKTFAYEASARVPFLAGAPRWMACKSGKGVEQVVGCAEVVR
ncbi:sulfatase-like hydrolase/transferase [Candidatus Poribacteria bacterium]|nr:sulfatase-like hydrolase/transferase [Candidatus Poribacteria bacterium]